MYFEAVEHKDEKKKKLALLLNLNKDAFRLAESVDFVEGDNAYNNWNKLLKSLLERNQTLTEKRHNFHRREQEPGESVDSYAVSLREAGAKCGFQGEEYTSRLVDQFILGLRDRATQSKLLQEPPTTLDDALSVARRFEAANATMQTLGSETSVTERFSRTKIAAINSMPTVKTCYTCNGFGHIAKQCPTLSSFKRNNASTKVCFHCHKPGHLARNCFTNNLKQGNDNFSKDPGQNTSNRQFQLCYRCGKQGYFEIPSNKI